MSCDHDLLHAGRRAADALDRQPVAGRLQGHRGIARGQYRKELGQPAPSLAGVDEALPIGDGEIDRRERARAQDGAGDDDAGAGLLMDHQIGADREHAGLQQHAQDFGGRAEPAADVAGAALVAHILPVGVAPASRHMADHTHGGERLGVAAAGFGEAVAHDGRLGRRLVGRAHEELGHHGQYDENDGAGQRGQADERMEYKTDREIERDPWQIEQRNRAEAGQISTDGVEIAQAAGCPRCGRRCATASAPACRRLGR